MTVNNASLLMLEVLWQERTGVFAKSLEYYLQLKFDLTSLRRHFPYSAQVSIISDLVDQGLVSESRCPKGRLPNTRNSLAFKKHCQMFPHELWKSIYTITRNGISAILERSDANLERYYETSLVKWQKGNGQVLRVTAPTAKRLNEVVEMLHGLPSYYGRVLHVGPNETFRGWTTRRGFGFQNAYSKVIEFESRSVSYAFDIDSLRLAHQVYLRNRWWRQIGFDSEECLYLLSLDGRCRLQVGNKYWGESTSITSRATMNKCTSIRLRPPLASRFFGQNATLLFSNFPWETATSHVLDFGKPFYFMHSTIGRAKLLLGHTLIGSVCCPGSYAIMPMSDLNGFDIVQERPMNDVDLRD